MFRIMIVRSQRDNYKSLYEYLTTTVDGVTRPAEFRDLEELDGKLWKMLNEQGYAKEDFIVVQVVDYKVDANDYRNIGRPHHRHDDDFGPGPARLNLASDKDVDDMLNDVFK